MDMDLDKKKELKYEPLTEEDFDFSVLFQDEEDGGFLTKLLPIINTVILFIILLISIFKK